MKKISHLETAKAIDRHERLCSGHFFGLPPEILWNRMALTSLQGTVPYSQTSGPTFEILQQTHSNFGDFKRTTNSTYSRLQKRSHRNVSFLNGIVIANHETRNTSTMGITKITASGKDVQNSNVLLIEVPMN